MQTQNKKQYIQKLINSSSFINNIRICNKCSCPFTNSLYLSFELSFYSFPNYNLQSQGPLSETFMSILAGDAKDEMTKLNLCSDSAIGVRISDCCIMSSQKFIWQNLILITSNLFLRISFNLFNLLKNYKSRK